MPVKSSPTHYILRLSGNPICWGQLSHERDLIRSSLKTPHCPCTIKRTSYTCTIYRTIQDHSMRVVNFSDARKRLKSVLDQVVEDSDCTVISRRDAEDAVVMSLNHFNALMETVHLLRSPANAAHLAKSIAQYRSGKIENHGLVDD